jgi:hypothetical protein
LRDMHNTFASPVKKQYDSTEMFIK